jgi:nucleoside-diphosphate-sugar epimerase
MRVFITGASGWIGSAVVPELLEAGHEVLGLARSDESAEPVAALLGMGGGGVATERDSPDPGLHPRVGNALVALGLADRGVRSSSVRFAPTVHGPGDHGFMATLVDLARRTRVAGYVDEGTSRWPAVHRLDAATLVRLALESAPAGSVLHAVDEEGILTRDIAAAIGEAVGVPARSIRAAEAAEHFGWIGMFFGIDSAASNALTRELLGWTPTHPELLEDIAAGVYSGVVPHAAAG